MENNVKVQDDTQSLQSCVSVSVTDLRIGNLINCFGECEVIGITEKKIKVRRKSESGTRFLIEKIPKSSLSLKYIPLTEELILRFGFNKIGINFELNKFELWKNVADGKYYFRYISAMKQNILIEKLHDLQNLYFSLRRSELQDVVLTEH